MLFICGRNKRRSKTAHDLFRKDRRMSVRSAGFSPKSPHQLTEADVTWAHVIFVMEQEHLSRLKVDYRHLDLPTTIVLDIPDEYEHMDLELVVLLTSGVEEYMT